MKKTVKLLLITVGIVVVIAAGLLGSLMYTMYYKATVVDTAESENGAYEVTLLAVGEPGWPFGPTAGRLVLREGQTVVAKLSIRIANDGGPITAGSWSVTWHDHDVKIRLSGEEQYDQLVTMYYNGQTERRWLTTQNGVETENPQAPEEPKTQEEEVQFERSQEEQRIVDGYQAIYEIFSDRPPDQFEVSYGAKESSSECVLREDEATVEYVRYDRISENEKCGLYVRFLGEKNADGTWFSLEGTIVDMYAYVYESGQVVSSGKTSWGDISSEAYQEVTGEK